MASQLLSIFVLLFIHCAVTVYGYGKFCENVTLEINYLFETSNTEEANRASFERHLYHSISSTSHLTKNGTFALSMFSDRPEHFDGERKPVCYETLQPITSCDQYIVTAIPDLISNSTRPENVENNYQYEAMFYGALSATTEWSPSVKASDAPAVVRLLVMAIDYKPTKPQRSPAERFNIDNTEPTCTGFDYPTPVDIAHAFNSADVYPIILVKDELWSETILTEYDSFLSSVGRPYYLAVIRDDYSDFANFAWRGFQTICGKLDRQKSRGTGAGTYIGAAFGGLSILAGLGFAGYIRYRNQKYDEYSVYESRVSGFFDGSNRGSIEMDKEQKDV